MEAISRNIRAVIIGAGVFVVVGGLIVGINLSGSGKDEETRAVATSPATPDLGVDAGVDGGR